MKTKTTTISNWRRALGSLVLIGATTIGLILPSTGQAQYLTEDFESAFSGTPAAPAGWTQSRPAQLIGLTSPISPTADGPQDWERNTWTGATYTINPHGSPGAPPSGTGLLYMNDYYFGPTGTNLGSRRIESPSMDLTPSTSPYLRFFYACTNAASTANMRVMGSADGGATWKVIHTMPCNGVAGWQRVNVLVPVAYRTATAKIGFEFTNVYGLNDYYIDAVTLDEFTPPTITSNAVTGNWSAPGTWVGGVVPTADNHVVIAAGAVITQDAAGVTRCQNLTVDGTIQSNATTANILHIMGDLTVNVGGVFNSFNGATGKRTYLAGNLGNAGTVNFSVGAGHLVHIGGAPASISGAGSFSTFISNMWCLNTGGLTFNTPIEVRNTFSLLDGPVNPNGNLTLGGGAVLTQTIERGRGSFTSAPIFSGGVTRSNIYLDSNSSLFPNDRQTIIPGEEIQSIVGTRTVQGTLTINTHGNVQLAYPLTVGTGAAGTLTLTRGILINNSTNVLTINNTASAGTAGTAPSTAALPTTHGSYVTGAVRIPYAATGTSTKTFPLGRGTAFNYPDLGPSANVQKSVALASGTGGNASQSPTVSLEGAPSGTINGPLTGLMGGYAYRVDLNGGADFGSLSTIQISGRNYTYGGGTNSDNMVGTQGELYVAQSAALTGGSWTQRSASVGGAAAFAANTNYPRTSAAAAPGPIAPLGTNGGYFALATSTNACSGIPTPGNTLSTLSVVCPGQNFTLSLQNATAGTGVTYQWESADDAGFTTNQANLGTAATQVTNQNAAKYYRCTVTCAAGPNSAPSTPLQVTMNVVPATPQDFESATFPPDCWSETDPSNRLFRPTAPPTSAFGIGTGSAEFNFYAASETTPFILSSPVFPAVPAGYQVAFDVAGASYTGGEIDVINLETSTDGGSNWSLLQVMTNEDGVGVLSTAPGQLGGYLAPSGDWESLDYAIPTGTNRVRFRAVSAYGNNVFLDNIRVQQTPTCFAPSGIIATATSTTTANILWNTTVGETYTIEIRSSGLPGSGPAGLDDSGTALAGPTFNATGLTPNTNYLAYLSADCGVNGTSGWSNGVAFRTGLCLANVNFPGGANDFNMTPVQVADINNTSASTAGYVDFTSVVGHVVPGQTYAFQIGRGTSYNFDQFQIYINWNQDIDFNDPGEAVFSSVIAPPFGTVFGSFTVPANAPAGNCVMRIRRQYDDVGFVDNYTACGNSDYGQVQDFTLNVCSPAAAVVTIVDNCAGNSMDAEVNISTFGSGGSGTISYALNGGTPVVVAGAVGVNSLTALGMVATPADNVTISVNNGTACSLDLGTYFSNCTDTLDCNAAVVARSYCYKNNETRTFHYVAEPGQTVSLNSIQGSIEVGSDVINFYDGPNNLSPSLGGGDFSGDLSAADFVSTGTDMFVQITSSASNSCFDGGQSVSWQWTVQCTPDCTPPSGIVDYVLPISCNPNGFYLEVTVFDAGFNDAAQTNPASVVDVEWTINGGSPGTLPGVGLFTPTQIGPFPLGSNVAVVFGHETNPACDAPMGVYTQANTCPPANDLCANAQVLPINAIGGCPGSAIQGTTAFATYDVTPAVTCNNGAGTIRDVWYTFNTGTVANPIQVRFTAGTATGYAAEFYTSAAGPGPTCLGASFGCLPNAAGGVNLTLAANTNYYIRIFTNSGTGTAGTFGICLAGSSCPAPTLPTATSITDSYANIGWTGAAGNYIVEYGPAVSFTTPGTGATPGAGGTIATGSTSPITISGLTASTQYRYYVRRDCGGGNYSFNSAMGLFNTLAAPPPAVTIAHATCGQTAAVPDAGCATNNSLLAQFPVTTTGTSLGVDVQLQSVDLIVTHTWRSDLQISLISPSGQVRSLINARGGSGANFGNPANCPTDAMRLIGGGTPLATMVAATAATGNWAPEQAFTGLTGNPNGTWTVRICDGAGGDVGTLNYVRLNFVDCVGPTFNLTAIPNCGSNQYSISVNISNMGSASSYVITNSVNASSVSATGTGAWVVGPFTSAVPVTLNLAHNSNPVCNATTGSVVFTCPAPNDLCADAIAVGCNETINGSTVGSTATGAPATCGDYVANTAGGVWYTTTGWNGDMTATTCPAGSFDTQVAVYTGTCGNFTCVAGNDDDCGLLSTATWTATQGTTYYIYVTGFGANTGSFTLGVTCGDFNPACVENQLAIEFQSDDYPGENTWEILDETGTVVIVGGPNPIPANSIGSQNMCLPDGCYRLRVLDSFGDGMFTSPFTGGYELREAGPNGRRIIDNSNNFGGGNESSIANGGTFCLPIGDIDLIYSNCDKLDWVNNKYLVCHADPAVSAVWVPNGANSVQSGGTGYAFWIFDPNGTYSFRRFRAHNASDGFSPANATRACHLKVNGWSNTALTPHIPQNVLMNVRVRPVVLGSLGEWGPACTMMIDPTRAACPLVNLQDDPANPSDYSCGVTRTFGGPNASANKIVARPPQFSPAPLAGGTGLRYQFRFRIPGEGVCIVRPMQTSPTLFLNWNANSGPQLEASKTYEVEVRVSKDLGATWCVDAPSPACDPSPVTTWGKTCNVTISSVAQLDGGSSSIATQGNGALTMYPNPNRGDQLFISLTEVAPEVTTVSVDIYDLTGKRVVARTIAVQDGYLNTNMELNGDLAGGLYMINITAGDKSYTERLVIQP